MQHVQVALIEALALSDPLLWACVLLVPELKVYRSVPTFGANVRLVTTNV